MMATDRVREPIGYIWLSNWRGSLSILNTFSIFFSFSSCCLRGFFFAYQHRPEYLSDVRERESLTTHTVDGCFCCCFCCCCCCCWCLNSLAKKRPIGLFFISTLAWLLFFLLSLMNCRCLGLHSSSSRRRRRRPALWRRVPLFVDVAALWHGHCRPTGCCCRRMAQTNWERKDVVYHE